MILAKAQEKAAAAAAVKQKADLYPKRGIKATHVVTISPKMPIMDEIARSRCIWLQPEPSPPGGGSLCR